MGTLFTKNAFNKNNLLFSALFLLVGMNAWAANDFYQKTWAALFAETQGTYKKTNLKTAKPAAIFNDTIPPVLHGLPSDLLFVECFDIPLPVVITATDNVEGNIVPEFIENIQNISCPFTIVRSWIATDSCGNTADFTQTIIISDIAPPIVVGPLDINAECGDGVLNSTPPFEDLCDPNPMNSYVDSVEQNGCEQLIKRTWTSTDACGNSTSAIQYIHVFDNEMPEVVFTDPQLQGLTDGDTLVLDCNDQPSFGVQDAVALDNCSNGVVSFTENGATFGDCPTDGFTVILSCTWTATDACGNATSVTLYMRMEDHAPPVFTDVPADLTIPCGGSVPSCGTPTYGDFCGPATLASTSVDVPNNDGFERVCTWTATDVCGNSATATQSISVLESDGPILIGVPADLTIYLPSGQTVPPVADVTALGGCGTNLPVIFDETSQTNGSGCETVITRTWTAMDNQGQMVEDEQIIRVINDLDFAIISNTPDTCAMSLGSVELSPNSYNYTWSDGGVGAARTGLLTGTYTVTVEEDGCTEELTVVVGNILQMLPPNIATSPETCGESNGAIFLSPDTYSFSWSDGETGPGRTGLSAGTYTVTVSNGTCNAILDIGIENVCECQPAVLDSLELVNADCGMANGSATLHLEGDEMDYGYLWVPDLGVPVGAGNARIGLLPQRYKVFVTFQGDPGCVEEFEFDVMDNCFRCPPTSNVNAMIVYTNGTAANVCLPVPYGTAVAKDIYLNDHSFVGSITACNQQNTFGYDYETLPAEEETNGYVAKWDYGPGVLQTLFFNIDELVAAMHQIDPKGEWRNDAKHQRIICTGTLGEYGSLKIRLLSTEMEYRLNIGASKAHLGIELSLEKGENKMLFVAPSSGCADTVNVNIEPINPNQFDFQLYPNPASQQATLDLQPAFGGPVSIRIFDRLGRLKTTISFQEVTDPFYSLHLTDYHEGLYFIYIQMPNNRSAILKLVVGNG